MFASHNQNSGLVYTALICAVLPMAGFLHGGATKHWVTKHRVHRGFCPKPVGFAPHGNFSMVSDTCLGCLYTQVVQLFIKTKLASI